MRLTSIKTGLLIKTRRAERTVRAGSLSRRDSFLRAGLRAGGGLLVPAVVAVALATSACGKKFTGDKQVYACSDGASIEVVYSTNRDSAMVRMGDESYKLKRTSSGSGVKYTNGDVVFWTKGRGAVVQIKGQVAHDGCRLAE